MITLRGIPAAPGIAMGRAVLYNSEKLLVPRHTITEDQISGEVLRFEEALIQTRHQILDIQKRLEEQLGQEHADIFNAHLLVLEDQSLREELLSGIKRQLLNVETVFDEVIQRYLKAFRKIEDEYLRDRTADVEDVRKRVLRNLLGKQTDLMHQLHDQER